jgi:hypothetical protein
MLETEHEEDPKIHKHEKILLINSLAGRDLKSVAARQRDCRGILAKNLGKFYFSDKFRKKGQFILFLGVKSENFSEFPIKDQPKKIFGAFFGENWGNICEVPKKRWPKWISGNFYGKMGKLGDFLNKTGDSKVVLRGEKQVQDACW